MSEPATFRVLPAFGAEEDGADVVAFTAFGAVLMHVADAADADAFEMDPFGDEPDELYEEDWLVRDPGGALMRVRMTCVGRGQITVKSLRTCRVCGCTDDRACTGGCAWAGDDLCSACAGAS